MKLAEFKRRLMTEPADRSEAMREARAAGGEFAEARAQSDLFERRLARALRVPLPHGLADQIILEQSLAEERAGPGTDWRQWGAIAAVLALAVALSTVLLQDRVPSNISAPVVGTSIAGSDSPRMLSLTELQEHIAWHWRSDGAEMVAAAQQTPTSLNRIEQVFAELGIQLEPELLGQIRTSKFCPTPNGAGAHIVMHTEQGPVTMYYMPHAQVPDSPARIELANGQESLVVNVERGSLALVADPGIDMPELAREIVRQVQFAPGSTI